MNRITGLSLALLAAPILALGLAGCGKQGVLEQPAPLFGSKAKAAYEAQKAQDAKDDAQRRSQESRPAEQSAGDNAPRTTRDVRDPGQVLTPASRNPILGAPNPFGAPVSPTN